MYKDHIKKFHLNYIVIQLSVIGLYTLAILGLTVYRYMTQEGNVEKGGVTLLSIFACLTYIAVPAI